MARVLKSIYNNPKHPAGFSNPRTLYHHVKNQGITKAKVDEFLKGQESYTLHRQLRKRFPRNRIYVLGIDQQWEVDLADLPSIKEENDGYRYLFCCIDVFSKYAWVIPLKRKTGEALLDGFKELFDNTERRPKTVRGDKGGEFNNAKVKAYLQQQGITFFKSQNEVKAAIVERFQRTLKGYMWRYFTNSGSYRYIDKLQDFVYAYNHRIHRSIKHRPADVTARNESEIRHILYPSLKKTLPKYKFKVGDQVRISYLKNPFQKGYQQNWTEEIYTISQRLPRRPPVYRIKDSENNILEGTFYNLELQKVIPPEYYRIENIIEERGKGRNKEYLVKWKGYPNSANSWIHHSQLKK